MDRYTSQYYGKKIDLDPELKNSSKSLTQTKSKAEIKKEIPPGFTYAKPTQANTLPVALLILFATPYINTAKSRSFLMNNSVDDSFDDTDTILDILSSVYPYMDPEYQDGLNFVFGLFEIRTLLRSLFDGTYQTARLLKADRPTSYQDRVIGIIKAFQPYIPLENQTVINKIIDVNSTLERLVLRLKRFRQYDIDTQDFRSNLARVTEMIDILKVLIPVEQQQQINKISSILKIAEAVELAQLSNAPREDESTSIVETNTIDNGGSNLTTDEVQDKLVKDLEAPRDKPNDNVENLSNVLKTMLNPEQAKSVDMIVKMAQLLAKDSSGEKNAD